MLMDKKWVLLTHKHGISLDLGYVDTTGLSFEWLQKSTLYNQHRQSPYVVGDHLKIFE